MEYPCKIHKNGQRRQFLNYIDHFFLEDIREIYCISFIIIIIDYAYKYNVAIDFWCKSLSKVIWDR